MAAKTLLPEKRPEYVRAEGKCNTLNHAYPCNAIIGILQCLVWASASSPVVVAHDHYVGCDLVGTIIEVTPAIKGRIDSAIPVHYRPDLGAILARGCSFLNSDGGEGRGSNRGVQRLLYCRAPRQRIKVVDADVEPVFACIGAATYVDGLSPGLVLI